MCRTFIVAVALAVATGGSLWAQAARTPEVQFKAAEQKELGDGDLKGAIKEYEKVVSGTDRALAAQALLRIAEIHQRLADAEENKIYERLIRDFSDQPAAAVARSRLGRPAVTRSESAGPRFISMPDLGPWFSGVAVSFDGRYIAYVKRTGGQTIVVRDLRTGRERNVTPTATGANDSMVSFPVFSKDGTQLAYVWTTEQSTDLRVISLRETAVTRFRKLLGDRYVQPFDWTPDGKSIVAAINHHDKTAEISLVAVADGSTRAVAPVTYEQWSAVFVSPDGKYIARDHRASPTEEQFDVFVLPIGGGPEVPVARHSAEDFLAGWSPDGRHLLFSSDRGNTPGLYAQGMADGRPDGSRPILITTNIGTTAPLTNRISSFGVTRSGALFYAGADQAVSSEIQDIEITEFNFETGAIGVPVGVGSDQHALNSAPAWSRDGRWLAFRSAPIGNTRAPSVVIRPVGTGATRELRPNLEGLSTLHWSPDGRFLVTSGPTGARAGIYRIDVQTGEASPIVLGRRKVQPVWSADGNSIYYRSNEAADSVAFIARDIASGSEREIIRRPSLGDLVLSPDGRYIATGVSDRTTKTRVMLLIPVAGGEPRVLKQISEPQDMGVKMWAPDSCSIVSVTVRPDEVWRLPIDGAPVRLPDEVRTLTGRPAVHPDGTRIAVPRRSTPSQTATPQQGVWVLENFLPKASK